MRFTDLNITADAAAKICAESPTEKGHLLPSQLVNASTVSAAMTAGTEAQKQAILPNVIPASSIILSDTSTIEANSGSLGLDAYGNPVTHDGVITGGSPIGGRRYFGAVEIAGVDAQSADIFQPLGRIRIPVQWYTAAFNGSLFVSGKVVIKNSLVNWTGAENPAIGIWLPGSSALTLKRGIYIQYDPTANIVILDINQFLPIVFSSPNYYIDTTGFETAGSVIRNEIASGVPTIAYTALVETGFPSVRQTTPVDNNIELEIWANLPVDAAGADSAGALSVAADLTFLQNA